MSVSKHNKNKFRAHVSATFSLSQVDGSDRHSGRRQWMARKARRAREFAARQRADELLRRRAAAAHVNLARGRLKTRLVPPLLASSHRRLLPLFSFPTPTCSAPPWPLARWQCGFRHAEITASINLHALHLRCSRHLPSLSDAGWRAPLLRCLSDSGGRDERRWARNEAEEDAGGRRWGEEVKGKTGMRHRRRGGGGAARLSLSLYSHRFCSRRSTARSSAADTNTARPSTRRAINAAGRERRRSAMWRWRRGEEVSPFPLFCCLEPRPAILSLPSLIEFLAFASWLPLLSSSHRPDAHSILINAEYKEGRGRSW